LVIETHWNVNEESVQMLHKYITHHETMLYQLRSLIQINRQ